MHTPEPSGNSQMHSSQRLSRRSRDDEPQSWLNPGGSKAESITHGFTDRHVRVFLGLLKFQDFKMLVTSASVLHPSHDNPTTMSEPSSSKKSKKADKVAAVAEAEAGEPQEAVNKNKRHRKDKREHKFVNKGQRLLTLGSLGHGRH